MFEKTYTTPQTAKDVTEEMLETVRDIVEGWYNDGPIDWEDVWNRADGTRLDDGTYLDMGDTNDSPAMRKIQRVIRAERREG
jgi:hypothetical protein